jgi:methionine-rich copper-binding protein CopC
VGPDIIAPTLSLIEGPVNTVNVYGPFGPFVISAADINDINPSFTRLHYSINTEPERTEYLSADTGGVFRLPLLDLSRQLFTGDTIHYYFTAVDGAHRPNSGRLPLSGAFSLIMVTSEVFENFERSGMDRWTVDDGWILRNDGYVSGHSIWFSSPNYPNNANASMTMNFDYDLSPYNGARLTFYRKNLIRSGDTCLVEASNNGGITWTRIGTITGLVAPIYQQMEVDMAPVLDPGSHHYKVRFRFVSDDTSTWVGVFLDDIGWSVDAVLDGLREEAALPKDMALHQNYPNPFNPETKIQFSVPSNSAVRLEIFDILGRQVSTLVDKELRPGDYSVTWNGTDNSNNPVASGIYFYRLTTNYGVRQQKMTLLR